jgi:hypothetical protein
MLPPLHIQVLHELVRLLSGLDWVLVGSTDLALQGLALLPGDIDLATDPATMPVIHERLARYAVDEPHRSEQGTYRSLISEYAIQGLKVEVVADYEVKVDGVWKAPPKPTRILVPLGAISVPAITLRHELNAYLGMNRPKDQEKIRLLKSAVASRGSR